MCAVDDAELYVRGAQTLVASWVAYAHGAEGADVVRAPGVAFGVFPRGPERGVYNNALLERGLDAPARTRAIEEMEGAYAAAGVERYAAWVHESDEPTRSALEARAYTFDTSTSAMGMGLADLRVPRPEAEISSASWPQYLEFLTKDELPDGLLTGVDPSAFHVLTARLDGEDVATGLAFDVARDCGIYNVTTLPHARRRGLGTAITAALAHDAGERGCTTASLQATSMAERLYARVGFRDLGRFLEFVPPSDAVAAAPAGSTRVRPARMAERDALEGLQRRASLHDPMYRAQLAAHRDPIELAAEQIAAGLVRVAEDDGVVVGFAVLLPRSGEGCELDGLFVEPHRWRAGVGRRLVDDARRLTCERGATRIDVVANPQAVAFYEAVGFDKVGEAQTRFGPAPRMSLSIVC